MSPAAHDPLTTPPSDPVPTRSRWPLSPLVRRLAVTVLGGGAVLAGLVLLVLPGPGTPLLLGGVALLGTEYPWVRRRAAPLLRWLKARVLARGGRKGPAQAATADDPPSPSRR